MRRVAYVGLFFLAGILMPVLIWVALFVAIRQPLLRAMRRVGYAMLFFLVGILMPVLIWVALVIAMREPLCQAVPRLALRWSQRTASLKRPMRQVVFVMLAFSFAILTPVLIWVGLAIAVHELLHRWHVSRLPSTMVCPIGTGCQPGSICAAGRPGYICIAGRCVPQY